MKLTIQQGNKAIKDHIHNPQLIKKKVQCPMKAFKKLSDHVCGQGEPILPKDSLGKWYLKGNQQLIR